MRDKAQSFRSYGIIPTLDLDATVIKSDIAVSSKLKDALRIGAALLEDVPKRLRDWHPGSDGKVLDLVHPSLFPLVYGRSRVLSSGSVELQQCMSYIGKGEIASTPDDVEVSVIDRSNYNTGTWRNTRPKSWSKAFQWLPCDVKFAGDDVRITSYINNLHPTLHPNLYSVIENFITKLIPTVQVSTITNVGEEIILELSRVAYSPMQHPVVTSCESWQFERIYFVGNFCQASYS